VNESQLDRGKAIHKETGQTFYYATRLLPERIRQPTYVLYGFFRIADEVVDVDEFVDAMLADIDTDRYETYGDLEGYMRGSAAAVGHMMTALMDPEDREAASPHAGALGEAFQLTNFIRDVREDIRDLDRVYLPRETLETYDVTVDQLRAEECTPGFRQAVQTELRRAEQLYRKGVAGIESLPEDCQFAVLLAATLYAEHHRLVRRQDFDVLSTRPSLSTPRKVAVVARTWWNWRRFGDPVTVFRRVSPVPEADATTGDLEDNTHILHPE